MEERKGVLTPEQEKVLDTLLVFKNKAAESVDGVAITLIDNQLLERLKSEANEKYPGVVETYVYPMIDALFQGIQAISEKE